jgi:hypothetical protein
MARRSPLKAPPLRTPGQSVDEEMQKLVEDKVMGYVFAAALALIVAVTEWLGQLVHAPRQPILFTALAFIAGGVATWKVMEIRHRVRRLRLGRDGERAVGQFLEGLRVEGAQVFHDVPAEGFNLDHVVISSHGIYSVETKTLTKPSPRSTVVVSSDALLVGGRRLDRDPIRQVVASARWLEQLLEISTGKRFAVRGVVLFPGWFVEQRATAGPVWVLEPKALPAFIAHEPETLPVTDVALVAYHLSQYIRSMSKLPE